MTTTAATPTATGSVGLGGGITVFDCSNNQIVCNETDGNQLDGIYIQNGTGNYVAANEVIGNALYSTVNYAPNGISLYGDTNTNLIDNDVECNNGIGILVSAGSGNSITYDGALGNDSDGIQVNGASNTLIQTSAIIGNGGWGINVINGSSNTTIRFNLIGANNLGGINVDSSSTGTVMYANFIFDETIVVQTKGASAVTTAVTNSVSDADAATCGL